MVTGILNPKWRLHGHTTLFRLTEALARQVIGTSIHSKYREEVINALNSVVQNRFTPYPFHFRQALRSADCRMEFVETTQLPIKVVEICFRAVDSFDRGSFPGFEAAIRLLELALLMASESCECPKCLEAAEAGEE
jgi:hypothetical protein